MADAPGMADTLALPAEYPAVSWDRKTALFAQLDTAGGTVMTADFQPMSHDLDPELDTLGELLVQFRQGDRAATGKLVDVFFPELRRMAAAHAA